MRCGLCRRSLPPPPPSIPVSVREGDGAHYVIAVEPDYYLEIMELFPKQLPRNVQLLRVGIRCYNAGTVGWVLQNAGLDLSRFQYFVWLNSSVRGPFLTAYAGPRPWHEHLTSLITQDTKLVGATISCAGVKLNKEHPTIHVPHVQASAAAWPRPVAVCGLGRPPARRVGARPSAKARRARRTARVWGSLVPPPPPSVSLRGTTTTSPLQCLPRAGMRRVHHAVLFDCVARPRAAAPGSWSP